MLKPALLSVSILQHMMSSCFSSYAHTVSTCYICGAYNFKGKFESQDEVQVKVVGLVGMVSVRSWVMHDEGPYKDRHMRVCVCVCL